MKVTYDKVEDASVLDQATGLLIECGCYDFIMIWHNDDRVLGVQAFQFNQDNGDDKAALVNDLLNNINITPNNIRVVLNTRKSMLVPEVYDAATQQNMLELFHGKEDVAVITNAVKDRSAMHVLYCIETPLKHVFEKHFSNISFLHANVFHANYDTDGLYCMLYHRQFKAVLVAGGELKLIQYFNYQAPSDVAFQLLNIASLFELDRNTFPLNLSGMIDVDSNLFREIEKYFLNLNTVLPEMKLPEVMDDSEQHYFSHVLNYIKN